MSVEFRFEGLKNFHNNINREWVISNGLGGYCSSSIIGAHNRTHQGYLVASLHNPVERYLVFSKTNEKLTCGSRVYDLSTGQHKGKYGSEYNIGNQFLKSFTYDGTASFFYDCGNIRLTKNVALVHGENKCVISYVVDNNGDAAKFSITPLLNYREVDKYQDKQTLSEEIKFEDLEELPVLDDNMIGFYYSPKSNEKYRVSVGCSEGKMVLRRDTFDDNVELQQELDAGNEGLDCNFCPIDFVIDVPAGGMKEISFVCDFSKLGKKEPKIIISTDTAKNCIEVEKKRIVESIENSDLGDDEFANALALSAEHFLAVSKSNDGMIIFPNIPYGTENESLAMIAFSGLLLETKKYEEAKEVLKHFAKGNKLKSLWLFIAVYNYLMAVNTEDAWNFVMDSLFPVLQQTLSTYRKGADSKIQMNEDGLLYKKEYGKTVEINALWFNALKSMEVISRGIAKRAKEGGADYLAYSAGLFELSGWVKDSFIKEFWYDQGGYLYDFVDGECKETEIKANQILAVSLPFSILPTHMEKSIVKAVQANVSIEGYMYAEFIKAYIKVNDDIESIEKIDSFFDSAKQEIYEKLVGFLCEKSDANAAASAVTVGEMLSAYEEVARMKSSIYHVN